MIGRWLRRRLCALGWHPSYMITDRRPGHERIVCKGCGTVLVA